MSGGTVGRHKRTKLGMLPGDIPIRKKAEMLEKGSLIQPTAMDPKGDLGVKRAKSLKNTVTKMANRRARRAPIETE